MAVGAFDPDPAVIGEESRMAESLSDLIGPLANQRYTGCLFCRHLDPQGLPRCAAYPLGIPLPILAGDLPHDRPLPGDHGIQFEPVDDPQAILDDLIAAKAPASD